jgi:hypothetical protein
MVIIGVGARANLELAKDMGLDISDSQAPAKEIDTVSALILGGKTIADLTTFICAGHPDCSSEPSLEPIAIAAEQCLQKLGQ